MRQCWASASFLVELVGQRLDEATRILLKLPCYRALDRGRQAVHRRLHDPTVVANEHGARRAREAKQSSGELRVELANVDAHVHLTRTSVVRPDIDAIALVLAPRLQIVGPRLRGRSELRDAVGVV